MTVKGLIDYLNAFPSDYLVQTRGDLEGGTDISICLPDEKVIAIIDTDANTLHRLSERERGLF